MNELEYTENKFCRCESTVTKISTGFGFKKRKGIPLPPLPVYIMYTVKAHSHLYFQQDSIMRYHF